MPWALTIASKGAQLGQHTLFPNDGVKSIRVAEKSGSFLGSVERSDDPTTWPLLLMSWAKCDYRQATFQGRS